jgi:hypothetical protein
MSNDHQIHGIGGTEVPRDLEMAREMGEQSADIATLKEGLASLRAKVDGACSDITDIKVMLATNKGGLRMLLTLGSAAAALGGIIATIIGEIIHWWHK